MSGLLKSFKRYFAFAVLILILFLLLWLRLFVAPQVPKEQPIITPTILQPSIPQPITSTFDIISQSPNINPGSTINYVYNGPSVSFPKTLPTYSPLEPTKIDLALANKYALQFGFEEEVSVSEKSKQGIPFFLWQKNNKVFSIGGSFPAISYTDYSSSPTSSNTTFDQQLLINRSKEELNKLDINPVDYDKPLFVFFKTVVNQQTQESELTETDHRNEASYVGVGLQYKFSSYSTISDAPLNVPIFLIFNKDGELYELSVYLLKVSQITSNTTVVDFDKALLQLNKKTIVLYAQSDTYKNEKDIHVYNIKVVNLSTVTITYFLPMNITSTIMPYYTFTGTASDEESGETINIIVLLPVNP